MQSARSTPFRSHHSRVTWYFPSPYATFAIFPVKTCVSGSISITLDITSSFALSRPNSRAAALAGCCHDVVQMTHRSRRDACAAMAETQPGLCLCAISRWKNASTSASRSPARVPA